MQLTLNQTLTVGNVTHLFFFFFNELVICVFLKTVFYMSVYLFWLSQRQFFTLVDNKDIIIIINSILNTCR